MDKEYSDSVISIFVRLYNDGIIYRGLRMVNWDPVSLTALSDEEVIYKEIDSKLYYVSYPFAGGEGSITVATTRPETILGDVAICVNPADERYTSYIGKEVLVPVINRRIPVIADEYVDAAFGTGALKITPAHDKNDNELGRKHNLRSLNTLDPEGKFTSVDLEDDLINDEVISYVGIDRFVLRKKIAADIEALGQLQKTEDYKGQVGTSERTGAIIESRLSLQWFMDMKKFIGKNPETIQSVADEEIKFYPPKFKNLYRHWMKNIKDWCISRQLWWGHRIPAWYDAEGNFVVAITREDAFEQFKIQNSKSKIEEITQDEDCLDTWFSSWLWPFEVFKGYSSPGNEEIKYYYPTQTLVTAPEIIFFWVARMIMAGYEYMDQKPFEAVYYTGIVRDKLGRKMSKSLGNSPDLLGLIYQYGADAVRFGIMIASPAGNDILFDESALEQGRNFNNKMWNALKLVKMWEGRRDGRGQMTDDSRGSSTIYHLSSANFAISWFENRLREVRAEVNEMMEQFKLSEALKLIYSLIWDDFCSWYLEWVKPGFEQPIENEVYHKTVSFFTELMELLHPFMPFITEEIYHLLYERNDDLIVKQTGKETDADPEVLKKGILLKALVTGLRDTRNKNQLKPKEAITLHIQTADAATYRSIESILAKQINSSSINYVSDVVGGSITTVIGKDKFYIETEQPINTAGQKDSLEKELAHLQGFLVSVEKKLGNEKFVQNAKPEVIALEQKKKSDAETKIRIIEESLAGL